MGANIIVIHHWISHTYIRSNKYFNYHFSKSHCTDIHWECNTDKVHFRLNSIDQWSGCRLMSERSRVRSLDVIMSFSIWSTVQTLNPSLCVLLRPIIEWICWLQRRTGVMITSAPNDSFSGHADSVAENSTAADADAQHAHATTTKTAATGEATTNICA